MTTRYGEINVLD
jgi:hypothetical protein